MPIWKIRAPNALSPLHPSDFSILFWLCGFGFGVEGGARREGRRGLKTVYSRMVYQKCAPSLDKHIVKHIVDAVFRSVPKFFIIG